ncbi:MAG TPA: hypothetical protein VLV86_23005 [Vicinamibacterales bacterium]|nr:hypothetical protein [Vicinamibacterales bacterium]
MLIRQRTVGILLVLQAVALAMIALAALDLYAHKRLDVIAGMNIWGYRGVVAKQKQPHEIRVVVIGGTRAFGLGMPATWTIATVVRQQMMLAIDRPGHELRQVVSLTLARPGALPDSYFGTLEHFAYLKPDFICIYDDLGVGGAALPEERSGLFARTGYWPALPIALLEKGMLWRFGSVRAGYVVDASIAETPGWIRRTAGTGVESVGEALLTTDRLLAPEWSVHRADDPERYVTQLMRAVDIALSMSRGVVLAVSPAEVPVQHANAGALLPRVEARVVSERRLRLVNLADEPQLLDASQRLDGWNLGGDAIAAAANRVAPALLDLLASVGSASTTRPAQ